MKSSIPDYLVVKSKSKSSKRILLQFIQSFLEFPNPLLGCQLQFILIKDVNTLFWIASFVNMAFLWLKSTLS